MALSDTDSAKAIERTPEGVGDCLQYFIEHARAQHEPAEWDRAHKEGMASELLTICLVCEWTTLHESAAGSKYKHPRYHHPLGGICNKIVG